MKNKLLTRKVLNEKWIKPSYINEYGDMFWYNKYGELHRAEDLPALIYSDGTKYWYKNGKQHRDGDKPATIWPCGSKYWYKNGQKHRNRDKPAIIYTNGLKFWYKNGELIR